MFRNLETAKELLKSKKEFIEVIERDIKVRLELIKAEKDTAKTLKAMVRKLK